jgi:predicted transcriptional regulator
MLPADHKPAIERLRELIREKSPNLLELSRAAEVSYTPLYKWVTGRQHTYNMLDGERVYYTLTGKTFLP